MDSTGWRQCLSVVALRPPTVTEAIVRPTDPPFTSSSSHSPSPLKTIHGNYGRVVSRTYAKTLIQVKATKAKINKWGYIQLKSTTKETNNKMKRQPTEWEKIFTYHISYKWLVFKLYEELIQKTEKISN